MAKCGKRCCLCQCGRWSERRCGKKSGTICGKCRRYYERTLGNMPRAEARFYVSQGLLTLLERLGAPHAVTSDLKNKVHAIGRMVQVEREAHG